MARGVNQNIFGRVSEIAVGKVTFVVELKLTKPYPYFQHDDREIGRDKYKVTAL